MKNGDDVEVCYSFIEPTGKEIIDHIQQNKHQVIECDDGKKYFFTNIIQRYQRDLVNVGDFVPFIGGCNGVFITELDIIIISMMYEEEEILIPLVIEHEILHELCGESSDDFFEKQLPDLLGRLREKTNPILLMSIVTFRNTNWHVFYSDEMATYMSGINQNSIWIKTKCIANSVIHPPLFDHDLFWCPLCEDWIPVTDVLSEGDSRNIKWMENMITHYRYYHEHYNKDDERVKCQILRECKTFLLGHNFMVDDVMKIGGATFETIDIARRIFDI